MTDGDAVRADQALARLEDVLASLEHPLLDLLQPGLSDTDVLEAMAPTGLTLPAEATALWRWRNGVRPGSFEPEALPGSNELPGGFVLLALQTAVDTYQHNLATFPWDQLDDLSRGWFPVADSGAYMMWVDCSGSPEGPARLICRYGHDYNPPEELARCSVPSVTRGVEVWAALLERRIWTVAGPGDIVSFDGHTHPLGDTAARRWQFVRHRDPDLPSGWPC